MKMSKHLILFLLLSLLPSLPLAAASAVPTMEPQELQELMGSPELVILDSRSAGAWSQSSEKIAGAIRASSSEYRVWKDTYPRNATIVLYCS